MSEGRINSAWEIESALFHIHSIAKLLENKALESDNSCSTEDNKISNTLLSLAQIISEKAEYCLMNIETIKTGKETPRDSLNQTELQ